MPTLGHRLQVLLDDERYERLRRRADETGVSVGALVRDAIDRAVPRVDPERARAIDELLALPPLPVGDWDELEDEILGMSDRSVDEPEPRLRAS